MPNNHMHDHNLIIELDNYCSNSELRMQMVNAIHNFGILVKD